MSQGSAARPLYQQIKDRITHRIASGEWPPGRKIPSENAIVKELGVSRMTVNRALREMALEGYLTRVAGVGSFVAEPPRQTSLVEIRDIAEDVRAAGCEHQARVLLQQAVALAPQEARKMESAVGRSAFRVRMVHSRDGLPIQHEDRFVAAEYLPDFLTLDFESTTPSEILLDRVVADEVEHIVKAVVPSAELRRHLAMTDEEPCLQLERRTWNRERVVTFAILTYPASRYGLGARYTVRGDSRRESPAFQPISHPSWNPED